MKLTKFQKDALKEVGNHGAGRASAALGKMTDKTVYIEMVKIRMLKIKDISSLVGGPTIPAVGSLFDVTGDLPGHFLLLSSKDVALNLLDLLKRKDEGSTKGIGKMEKDILKEVGNILVGSYLASLADLAKINVVESVPRLIINNTDAIFREIEEASGKDFEYVLVVDARINIEKKNFTEELILMLKQNSFKFLFDSLIKRIEGPTK